MKRVLMTDELFDALGAPKVEWGEPDTDGFYSPTVYADTTEATLRAAAIKTRDRLAFFLWSEDDSGDDNDLIAAYDELRDLLGPSTEESVAETLRAALQQPAVQPEGGPE